MISAFGDPLGNADDLATGLDRFRSGFASGFDISDPGDGGAMVVKGELTLKALRRPVSIPFRYSLNEAADGSRRVSADGEFEIERKDYNIGTGVWSNSFLFHDRIAIAVHLELICG